MQIRWMSLTKDVQTDSVHNGRDNGSGPFRSTVNLWWGTKRT